MESYQLPLAPEKCQHLPTIHHPDADKASNQCYIGNQKISSLPAVCDMDIVISSNLKWQQHVCSIVSEAFIHSHQTVSVATMSGFCSKHTYVTYIRLLLEYNIVIWFPFLKSDISMVESV